MTDIKTIIFDLYGTLTCFSPPREEIQAKAAKKFGYKLTLKGINRGYFKADDGTTQEINNNRIDELIDVLDEIEGKTVIWAHWQNDVKHIIKAVVKEYGEGCCVDYYGLTPQSERQDNINKFQTILK